MAILLHGIKFCFLLLRAIKIFLDWNYYFVKHKTKTYYKTHLTKLELEGTNGYKNNMHFLIISYSLKYSLLFVNIYLSFVAIIYYRLVSLIRTGLYNFWSCTNLKLKIMIKLHFLNMCVYNIKYGCTLYTFTKDNT